MRLLGGRGAAAALVGPVNRRLLRLHPSVARVEEDDEAARGQSEQSGQHQHRH